jgi:hypothetical protein
MFFSLVLLSSQLPVKGELATVGWTASFLILVSFINRLVSRLVFGLTR